MALSAAAAVLSPDLRKRIEIMAEHIARNGHEFEHTVRQKNVNNPQFAFLYHGEGSEYYQQILTSYRGQPAAGAAASSLDLPDISRRWREPPVYPLSAEIERQLFEVIASLEAMASRDAVRNGRTWVECNTAVATQIAGNITKHTATLPKASHRLHVLYLVHDLLQTEAARKDGLTPLIRAFKAYLPYMLRPAYQLAMATSPTGEEAGRVLRLLQLWVERNILDSKEADEIRALVTSGDEGSVSSQAGKPRPGGGAFGQAVQQQAHHQIRPPMHHQTAMPSHMQQPVAAARTYAVGVGGLPQYQVRPPLNSGMLGGGLANNMQQHSRVTPPSGMSGMMTPGLLPTPSGGQMPRLQGYRPNHFPGINGKHTPETLPVGVLATMVMHAVRRIGRTNFVPYRPLDTTMTPQTLPPMDIPNQRLLERVEDFYQDLKDEERGSSSSRSSSSRSRSASRSRSRSRSPVRPAPGMMAGMMSMVPPASHGGVGFSAVPPPVVD